MEPAMWRSIRPNLPSPEAASALLKRFDHGVEIHLQRLIMVEDWRYLALDV
jgi:hypothetical protein